LLYLQQQGKIDPFLQPTSSLPAPRKSSPENVPQPPSSALRNQLVQKLGRKLKRVEADFVRQVQKCYENSRQGFFTKANLISMSESPSETFSGGWERLSLWPAPPRDDFQFWQYVALELDNRNVRWPKFMNEITDLETVRSEVEKWEHEKEITRWKDWFRRLPVSAPPPAEMGVLELRLAIFPDEARLQWRTDPNADFAEFKRTQAKRFGSLFDEQKLPLIHNSLILWSLCHDNWQYGNWWSLRYNNSDAKTTLNRLLRTELAPELIVSPDGKPYPRHDLPLRLELTLHRAKEGHYRLTLVQPDGKILSRILLILEGQPTLYLTPEGIFPGPPGAVLANDLEKHIPVEAIETPEALGYLHSAGASLPEELQRRIASIPVKITVACGIKQAHLGGDIEDILIEVTAAAPEMQKEKFTANGWEPISKASAQPQKTAAKNSLTVHDRQLQSHFPDLLKQLSAKWNAYPGDWTLRLTKKTPEAFALWLKSLPPEFEVLLSKDLATLRDEPISGSVAFDIFESGIDWFDVQVKLELADTTLTPEELKLLLNSRGTYVRLGKKGWRRLQFNLSPEDDQQLARLGLHARDFSAEPQRLHALQLADEAAKKFLGPDRAEKIQRRVSDLKTRVVPPLPGGIVATLRPYQTEGFYFLAYLTTNHFGGVLADDMGLGKTLQTLAWIAWLREMPGNGQSSPHPALVVCPKSVMDNWRAEAERFYPALRVQIWRGESAEALGAACAGCDLLIINYAQLRALSPEIASVPWLAAILDEAQYIKNPDSQTAQSARALRSERKLALTGTPIENRLLDLWSIFSFAMPGILGNRADFLRRFDAKGDSLARRRLAARVRPFLLRRTKAQVASDLPDRVEEDLYCELETEQKTLYRAELKRARQLLLGLKTASELNEQRFNILTSLLRLRQICCHPALIDGKFRHAEAAKVSALEDLLEPLMAEGHKVLVFSQFVTMLNILRDKLTERGWPHFYLAGDTENRGDLVREFQSAKTGATFLISLKAGGFGLNLTSASYVVLFDPWWNPAVENQAIDRTHRIGQTRKVMAYRLLMRDTIEQKIRQLQKQKGTLADDVLGEERFAQSLTLNDLHFLFAD